MRLLLDTHIFLWTMTRDRRLSPSARSMIADGEIYVSVISLWEIAIKYARRSGKPHDMPISAAEATRRLKGTDASILAVLPAHALMLESLPLLHRDPFDRMLVAQARSEPLRLLTSDKTVAAYGDGVELV